MNSSSDTEIAFWQRNPHICRGEETVMGSRIRRRFIRFLRKKYGIWWVRVNYPHILLANIEQA